MKRILGFMLSLILVCGMFVPAVHAESNNVYQVDITCPNWYTEMDPAKLVFEVQTPGFTLFRQPVLVYSDGPNSFKDETGMRRNDIEYYLAVGLNTEATFTEGDEIRVCLNGHMSDFETTENHLTESMEGCVSVSYLNVAAYSELDRMFFDPNGLDVNSKLSDLFYVYDFGDMNCDINTTVYVGDSVDAPVMQDEDTFNPGTSYLFEVFARPQKMNQKIIAAEENVSCPETLRFLSDRTVTNDPADPDAVKLYFQYDPVVYYKIDKFVGEGYRVFVTEALSGSHIDEATPGTQIAISVRVPPELEFDHWEIEGMTLPENVATNPNAVFRMPANDIKVIPMTHSAPIPFSDIHPDDWFFRPAMWAYRADIVTGVTKTEFGPRDWCTRAQGTTMLVNYAIHNPSADGLENPFTDVQPDDWFYNHVVWGYHQGIFKGKTESVFGPRETMTRAQFVTMLWSYHGRMSVNNDLPFTDVDPDAYYYEPICWAVQNNIVSGADAEHFHPNDVLTRAEAAAILYRASQNLYY